MSQEYGYGALRVFYENVFKWNYHNALKLLSGAESMAYIVFLT